METVPYRFLDQPDDVAGFLAQIRGEPAVAIDFEADSLHSYREKICLAQISTPTANAVLDPLAAPQALRDLAPLLADPAVEKVFHGSDYDLRLLKKDGAVEVKNLFDTMVASQLVGRPRVGLAALLEEEFGVRLDKKYQRADWSARPLGPELLAYAALDTAHLLPLRDRLAAELDRLGRRHWAAEEFELLVRLEPSPPRAPWCLDVKGAARLTPPQLAVLQALLVVRDEAARSWDRPPFKVLGNDVLLAWAQSPPAGRDDLLETQGAGRGVLGRLAEPLLQAVQAAQAQPPEAWPRPPRGTYDPMTPEQEKRLKRLKHARGQASERLGIEPGLLGNSATLERLARMEPESAREALPGQLKRWQLEAVGGDLGPALDG